MDGVSALMSSPGQKGSHYLTLQGGTHVIPSVAGRYDPAAATVPRAGRGSSPCAARGHRGTVSVEQNEHVVTHPAPSASRFTSRRGHRPLYRDRTCHGFAGHSGSHLLGTLPGHRHGDHEKRPSPVKISRGADLAGIRLGSARRAVPGAHRATAPCARAPPWPPPRVPGWGAPRRPRRGPAGLRRGSVRPAPSHCPPGRTGRLRRAPPVPVR